MSVQGDSPEAASPQPRPDPTQTAATAGLGNPRQELYLLPVLGFSLILATFQYLMIFNILTEISKDFSSAPSVTNWLAISTTLVTAVATGILPALGSIVGFRRVLVAAMLCVAAGSLLGAVAPNIGVLITGRIIAAVGMATPLITIAVMRERRSGAGLSKAIGTIAAMEGIAAVLSGVVGGLIQETFSSSWRSIFWVVSALGIVAAFCCLRAVPDNAVKQNRRIDYPGAVLLGSGLVLLLLPISQGTTWGWTSGRTLSLLMAGVLLITIFVLVENRVVDPLVQLRVMRRPGVVTGVVFVASSAGVTAIVQATVPSFLQTPEAVGYGFGASALEAGAYLVPCWLAVTVVARVIGSLTAVVSPRILVAGGLALAGGSLLTMSFVHDSVLSIVLLTTVFGIGFGTVLTGGYVVATGAVDPADSGTASSVTGTFAGVSGSVAVATVAAVLTSSLISLGDFQLPTASAYTTTWVIGACVAFAGMVFALFAPGAGRRIT